MLAAIKTYVDSLPDQFNTISSDRKMILDKLAAHISSRLTEKQPVNLLYVCVHNSRRSHFGQVWAQVAATYYNIRGIRTFSAGTEVTAIHPNTVAALKRAGFEAGSDGKENNPVYKLTYSKDQPEITCFSKHHEDPSIPHTSLVAIMTCGEAETECPFVPGTDYKASTTYEDPKSSDGTARMESVYDTRCRQIATEIFYMFSQIKTN